jgi:hypothetical protein
MRDEHDAGFIRQRRNLMIVSLVLLFSEVSALSIGKLNIFGNEIEIDRPQSVNLALWIASLYWLWRFYQYSRPHIAGTLKGAIYQRVQEICLPTAVQVVLRGNPSLLEPFPDHPEHRPDISIKTYTFWGHMPDYLEVGLELNRSIRTSSVAVVQGSGEFRIRITSGDLRKLRLRAWIHMIVHTRHFTDYILPYVLFGLPLCYVVYRVIQKAM